MLTLLIQNSGNLDYLDFKIMIINSINENYLSFLQFDLNCDTHYGIKNK